MKKRIFIGLIIFILFVPMAQGFSLKWQTNIAISSTKAPVCFDIDGDGDMEIFLSGNPTQGNINAGRIFCLDGNTGNIIWDESWTQSYQDPQAPLAIGDLDNNGDYEIVCAEQTHTVARNCEDGSVFWNSQVPSGWHHLSVVEIDGSPYVFVTCNTGGYKSISRLKGTDGSLVAQSTSISYPCYGGISAGDINKDGKIEILVNDGSLKCFDEDLNLMWSRPSDGESACPVLVDFNDDGYLDVVGLTTVSKNSGFTIISGKDGTVIKNLPAQGLPTHITPVVYDIDKDGNLEFITAYGSHIFVYDMVLETVDAELNHGGYYYRGTHPPCVANVYGNSNLEIIVDGSWDGAVSIWDSNFNRVATINDWGANVIVQDIDNDDLNEIILSRNTGIVCYDTDAQSLDADTSTHYYGNRRTGAESVYTGGSPPPPPPDVTCWACSNGNKISTTFPPETVCGQGLASNYPYASEPDDCSLPPTICWKCIDGALEQILVPNEGECPEGWSETEPICESDPIPGFEIFLFILALAIIIWRKKR